MKKNMQEACREKRPGNGEQEGKVSKYKENLLLVAQIELKQPTEVPNIFSRSSIMHQETLNQITSSFKGANV